MSQRPAAASVPGGHGTAAATSVTATPGELNVRYTHSGSRYVLGYGADTFGIWDRQAPGPPVETFPRNDEGWRSAWIRYTSLEPNHAEVGDASGQGPSMASAGSTSTVPEEGDDKVLQYTHSGVTYLLGYGRTFFGIWQRSDPSRPIERFARDDAGWAAAWRRFTSLESNYAEVRLSDSGTT